MLSFAICVSAHAATAAEAAPGSCVAAAGAYATFGPDFAAAEGLLQSAVACFGAAVDASPQDTR